MNFAINNVIIIVKPLRPTGQAGNGMINDSSAGVAEHCSLQEVLEGKKCNLHLLFKLYFTEIFTHFPVFSGALGGVCRHAV